MFKKGFNRFPITLAPMGAAAFWGQNRGEPQQIRRPQKPLEAGWFHPVLEKKLKRTAG